MKWLYKESNTWTPDSANLIKKYDYVYSSSTEGMAWKDLLTKYDGKTITYDSIGNPTSYMGSTMYWEGRTLVEQVKNGTTITYSYDSSDMRTSKTVGGVKHNYYYVEGKLMYEDCPSYKLYYSYDANGFLSGIKRILANGSTENYGVHCNIFGDVISIYYADGFLAATYTYDSWGKLLAVTDAHGNDMTGVNDIWTQNSIRYRGYVYDEETQLYYLQSRYYDPNTCRFINADDYSVLGETPTGITGKNLFSYCDCNPVNRVDSSGEFWGMITGAVLGAVSGGISSHFAEDEIWWKGAIAGAITGAMSGLLVDATVVTGGTVAFVAATLGNGAINLINTILVDIFNQNNINPAECAVDFVIGSLFGALDYGISYDPSKIFKGKLWERLKQSFVDIWQVDDVVKHGKTIAATSGQKVSQAVAELSTSMMFSTVLDIFSDLLKMTYRL